MAMAPKNVVGRVGALAVALGIGTAIAYFPAVATAESPESSSSESESSAEPADAHDEEAEDAEAEEPDNEDDTEIDEVETEDDQVETEDDEAEEQEPEVEVVVDEAEEQDEVQENDQPEDTDTFEPATEPAIATVAVDTAAPIPQPEPAQNPAMWTVAAVARRELAVADSPLGTQQQLAAEQLAAQTAATLPVQLMKVVLRASWLSTAEREYALVGGPDQANIDALDAALDEYAMAAAFQQQILNSNKPTVVTQVAPPHVWFGQSVTGSRNLYDNPDTVYRFMGVNKASTYVITGRFENYDPNDPTSVPTDTTFSVLTGLTGTTAQVLTKDDLIINPDGTFTITVSAEPGEPGTNHLQIPPEATLIAARNTLGDWDSEVPMTLSIERVAGPPNSLFSELGGFAIPFIGPTVADSPVLTALVSLVPPLPYTPPIVRGVFAAVIMLLGVQNENTYIQVATVDPATGEQRPPNVLPNPTRNAQFLATQLQSAGYFQLADDEALVVTITPNNARYFVVPVTNDWTVTDNYWDQQTSLNSSQAQKNPDGTYTLVISKTDPNIAAAGEDPAYVKNWVSTGGLNQGTISMRFQNLDPENDVLPTVEAKTVKLQDLADELPDGIATVSADGRQVQLDERKAGYDNRWAPYPQP